MEGLKVVFVGNGGSGKTSYLMTYTNNSTFPGEHIPTIFDNYGYNRLYNGKPIFIGLWDTAGGEDYWRLRPLSYPQTDTFVICFSIARKRSLDAVWAGWYPEIKKHAPSAKIILAGLKSDLRESKEYLPSDWTARDPMTFVTVEEGRLMAQRIGAHAYIECSALRNKNLLVNCNTVMNAVLHTHFNEPIPKKIIPSIFSSVKKKFQKVSLFNKNESYDDKLVVCNTYSYSPLSIFGHAAAYTNNKLYVFGGYNNSATNEFVTNPSAWDGVSANKWLELPVSPTILSPRAYLSAGVVTVAEPSSASSVTSSRVLIFGGKSNGYHNDIVCFNPETKIFEKLEVTGQIPYRRYGMSAVTYNNELYIFGGFDSDSSPCNDCFKFNLDTREWSKVSLNGQVPPPRHFHTAVCAPELSLMIVYGGKSGVQTLDDMFSVNLVTGECKQIIARNPKDSPGPRQNHACEYIGRGVMVLVGGINQSKAVTDGVFLFFLEDQRWSSATVKGYHPQLHSHSVVFVNSEAEIWACGGKDSKDNLYLVTKFRMARNTPRMYDVLPASAVRDILACLPPSSLARLCEVSRRFYKLASDEILWITHCRALSPSYTPQKDASSRMVYQTLLNMWYNDFSKRPEPALAEYQAPGGPGWSYY